MVIPLASFSCNAIVPVVGSSALLLCNEKLISLVDITFNELLASALWNILPELLTLISPLNVDVF